VHDERPVARPDSHGLLNPPLPADFVVRPPTPPAPEHADDDGPNRAVEPTVQVSIGRIEVRARIDAPTGSEPKRPARKTLTLDEYATLRNTR
jgi:hypothetical protein